MKVLVVDDNLAVLEQVSALASSLSDEVAVAKNGLDAQEKLQAQSFDLLIVDHLMPLMNGIQLLKNLSQSTLASPVATVFMTTQGRDNVKELIEQGLCDFIIDKPVDESHLLSLINQLNKQNTARKSL